MKSLFTFEEINLMYLYNTDTREGLINNIEEMQEYLQIDEQELLNLSNAVLKKLRLMSDIEFSKIDLLPDFMECFNNA